jgi:AcrR family transcriptional regulator
MSPRSTSAARPARRTNTADAILSAAKELFLADGYDGVNLERIAEHGGVSRQTVYNRFGSKEAVFRSMVEFHWASIRIDEIFSRTEAPGGDSAQVVLRKFADAIFRFVSETEQIAFTRLVIAESRRLPWIGQEFYRLGKKPLLEAFVACIETMTADGRLSCEHPEIAAHQFLGLIQEFVVWPKVMAVGPQDADMPAKKVVVDEAIRMFLLRYGSAKVER